MILWVKNRVLQEENNTLVMEEQLQHQKYCEMLDVMEHNRELIHDTKHHFLVVQEYLKNEEYENLQKYVKQVSEEFQRTVPKVYTGIKILDFILEQKRVVAQKSGIRYEMDTMLLTGIPMTEQETCALFGNLLDNAIEACCLVETEEKWIKIQIKQINQLLSIELLNTFEIPCIRKQGVFETIKEERSAHGYGIKSMQRIVDKYQGLITYEEKEKIFTTKITFLMCEYRSSKEKWKMADSRVLEMYAGNLLEEMQEIEKMIPGDQENEIVSSHTVGCSAFLTIYCC